MIGSRNDMKALVPGVALKNRRTVAQPPHILDAPAALLNIETVKMLTGLSRSTIYRMIAVGSFPEPVKVGPKTSRWRAGKINAWLVERSPEPA